MTALLDLPPAAYDERRAARYDEESTFDKGDRERHKQVLGAVLDYLRAQNSRFLDLGCGTGFFSEMLLQRDAGGSGVLIDASPAMLAVAGARLAAHAARLELRVAYFQRLDWTPYEGSFDVVFSSMAIHHLDDAEKDALYAEIRRVLRPGGVFMLLDIFKLDDPWAQGLVEHVACADMGARLMQSMELDWRPPELEVDRMIERDRQIRAREGDREASLARIQSALFAAGFRNVVQAHQDGRIGIWIARC